MKSSEHGYDIEYWENINLFKKLYIYTHTYI